MKPASAFRCLSPLQTNEEQRIPSEENLYKEVSKNMFI